MENEKVNKERQHQVEMKTLSGNLGTVRLELETMKRRLREMEGNATLQKQKADGELLYIFLSVYLSVCLSVCMSVCLSICLSVCMSVYLSICLHVCLSVYLSVCPSIKRNFFVLTDLQIECNSLQEKNRTLLDKLVNRYNLHV